MLTITVRDSQESLIVYGQLHEYRYQPNGDLTILLTKYHCPCKCKDGVTHNGFVIPS